MAPRYPIEKIVWIRKKPEKAGAVGNMRDIREKQN